jgi:hypothetical protein
MLQVSYGGNSQSALQINNLNKIKWTIIIGYTLTFFLTNS